MCDKEGPLLGGAWPVANSANEPAQMNIARESSTGVRATAPHTHVLTKSGTCRAPRGDETRRSVSPNRSLISFTWDSRLSRAGQLQLLLWLLPRLPPPPPPPRLVPLLELAIEWGPPRSRSQTGPCGTSSALELSLGAGDTRTRGACYNGAQTSDRFPDNLASAAGPLSQAAA